MYMYVGLLVYLLGEHMKYCVLTSQDWCQNSSHNI